jgi:hypothetical protein
MRPTPRDAAAPAGPDDPHPDGRVRLAVVLLSLALAGVLATALVALFPLVRAGLPTARPTGTAPVGDLVVGQCFDRAGDPDTALPAADPAPVHPVDCAAPHDSEVLGPAHPDARPDTPLADLTAQGEDLCRDRLHGYVLDPLSLPLDAHIVWYLVQPSPWRVDSTWIQCALGTDRPVSRSLRVDATTLTADQVRYLEAVRDSEATLDEIDATPDWQNRRSLTPRMAAEVARERDALARGPWPAAVTAAMRLLVADETDAVRIWRRAATARDADRLEASMDEAVGVSLENHKVVRRLLGLPSAQGQPPRRP